MLKKATDFVMQFYQETNKDTSQLQQRFQEIEREIALTGSYKHTKEELEFGAKIAWRNSNKCIGRLFWNSLTVFDQRELCTEESVFNALLQHIRYATNGGKIRPTISVFEHSRVRIWNDQLIRYAGYEVDGQIIGDSSSIQVTKQCEKLGFVGEKTNFDLLPLIIQIDGQMPKIFELPKEDILEIPLAHSAYDWFQTLGLKWYAVPIISNMGFEIGGITYEAAPFNGWYMGTEIGARNLADVERYNTLPQIAEKMGLSTTKASSLWQDRALIELNHAVLESFKNQGVSIVDHHTAAQQFKLFEEQEAKQQRKVTGNWVWLVPPLAAATTHIFHKTYDNTKKSPNYVYQKCPFNK